MNEGRGRSDGHRTAAASAEAPTAAFAAATIGGAAVGVVVSARVSGRAKRPHLGTGCGGGSTTAAEQPTPWWKCYQRAKTRDFETIAP